MALFGNKKKKDEKEKPSPPQRDPANGRFEEGPGSQEGGVAPAPGPAPGPGVGPGPGTGPTAVGMVGSQSLPAQAPPMRPSGGPMSQSMQGRGDMSMGGPGPREAERMNGPLNGGPAVGPPNQLSQSNGALPPGAPPPNTSSVIYPWSHRRLGLLPPTPFPGGPELKGSAAVRSSPPPFPRYGHSVNAMMTMSGTSGAGDLFIFGGLVRNEVRNDLYVLNVTPLPAGTPPQAVHNQVLTVGLVETHGERPPPRLGHASVGVGNVLIVWGGDTKQRPEELQDPGLYLLNLSTREWTRVHVAGLAPDGRFGHKAAIVGSRFYVFGGQTDDLRFMNDLWSFDLQKLKSGAPSWSYLELPAQAPAPSKRTGHSIVTHGDCIYVFGGTDGNYHYNDTWCFDTNTGAWSELDCIGYIPLPREGHSATLVDDVMYVLGGRGVDGKDLEDLAAFKISNQRWYMFQNMGPAPAGRSGHSMVSWQGKVYVLGGESYNTPPDDPSIVHVLDTGKIKYPPDTSRNNATARQSSNPALQQQQQRNLASQQGSAPLPPGGIPANAQDPRRAASPTVQGQRVAMGSTGNASIGQTLLQQSGPAPSQEVYGPDPRLAKRATTGAPMSNGAPPRPRRDDDPAMNRRTMGAIGTTSASRAMSPVNGQPIQGNPPANGSPKQKSSAEFAAAGQRSMSPQNTGKVRSANGLVNGFSGPAASPPASVKSPPTSNLARAVRSPSPYADPIGPKAYDPTYGVKEVAVAPPSQAMERQMTWMRTALAAAMKQGFVVPSPDEDADKELKALSVGDESSGQRRLVSALIQLKQELAKAKGQMTEQARILDDRVMSATRGKTAALQEASFYRAKLSAHESGSASDLGKLERERIAELEQKVSDAVISKSVLERQIVQLNSEMENEKEMRMMAEDRSATALQRAQNAETSHARVLADHSELQTKSRDMDSTLQGHLEQLTLLQSAHSQLQVEHDHHKGIHAASEDSNTQFTSALEQLQTTLLAANARADEMESLWEQSKSELDDLRTTNTRLQQDLETQTSETFAASNRADEMDRVLRTMREENEAMRALTSGSVAELVASSRETKNRDSASIELHNGRARAVEEEAKGLRSLHQQSVSKMEVLSAELADIKARNLQLEKHLLSSRGEVDALQSRHASALNDAGRIRAQINARDADLKEKSRVAEAAEVKAGLLRSLMAENGLNVEDEYANRSFDSLASNGDNSELSGLRARLEQRTRSHRELESAHEEMQRELQATDERYRQAARKHEAAAEEISSLVQEVQRLRSGGATSVQSPSAEGNGNGGAEEELAALQERHRGLEQTHMKAVQYVKGTEKMLRRMKLEMAKYKDRTEELEAELATAQGDSSAGGTAMRGQMETLQGQLNQLRTTSDQSRAENEKLQQHITSLQSEYARTMGQRQEEWASRTKAAESEIRTLEEAHVKTRKDLDEAQQLNKSLNDLLLQQSGKRSPGSSGSTAGDGEARKQLETQLIQAQKQAEWLRQENADLETRCRDAESKISLLLDHMETNESASHSSHDPRFDGGGGWAPNPRRESAGLDSIESEYSAAGPMEQSKPVGANGRR